MEGVVIPKTQKEQIAQDKFEPPYFLEKSPPLYPDMSVRLGEEGVVMVRVLIGSDGVPKKVELQTSSGFERLDQSALNTVMRWRFMPGTRGGVAETMWYRVPITFKLQIPEKESQQGINFDKKNKEDRRLEQEAKEAEDHRQQQIKRLKRFGATTSEPVDPVNEFKGGVRPSDSYLARLRARVKPNITFSESQLQSIRGNPAAEVEVTVSASGQIIGMKLTQSSGNADWDQAVLKAIEKTETLPRDENGKIPSKLLFVFRPRE